MLALLVCAVACWDLRRPTTPRRRRWRPRSTDSFPAKERTTKLGRVRQHGLCRRRQEASRRRGARRREADGENTFNTVYREIDYLLPLTENWTLRAGAQITDQRAVGDALAARTKEKYWDTQARGARVQLIYRELMLTAAYSITNSGNNIQSPWGVYAGYLSLRDQDFDRANEKALLFWLAYDASRTVTAGFSAFAKLAWGWDAINPKTRVEAPDQAEYDLTVDYH